MTSRERTLAVLEPDRLLPLPDACARARGALGEHPGLPSRRRRIPLQVTFLANNGKWNMSRLEL
jgi:hypothetical protein